MMDLSIIILNFNTKEYLDKLITTLRKADWQGIQHELIIVDNASTDGSQEMMKKSFPRLRLVKNDHNFGFARANNIGSRFAKGKFLLFLNSDTQVYPSSIKLLFDYVRASDYVGGTAKLVLANKKIDWACHRGFPTPWNAFCYFAGLEYLLGKIKFFGGYHQKWKNLKSAHQIDCISGACFLIDHKVFQKIGGWDESYFMYGEDIDLCYQLAQKGYKLAYVPESEIVHYKKKSGRSKSLSKNSDQKIKNIKSNTKEHFFYTMKLFYQKNYSDKYPKLVYQFILLGIKIVSKFKN